MCTVKYEFHLCDAIFERFPTLGRIIINWFTQIVMFFFLNIFLERERQNSEEETTEIDEIETRPSQQSQQTMMKPKFFLLW